MFDLNFIIEIDLKKFDIPVEYLTPESMFKR